MGVWALLLAGVCFIGAMAVPLAMRGWRPLLTVCVAGAAFFAWMTLTIDAPGSPAQAIGGFLGGLMLFGFAGGAVARAVMLIGRRPESRDFES